MDGDGDYLCFIGERLMSGDPDIGAEEYDYLLVNGFLNDGCYFIGRDGLD